MTGNIRAALAELMDATAADHEHWTYAAVRPLEVPPSWRPGQPVRSDCSKGVQYLCRWADGPDPMNNDFGPFGNSTTIALTLRHLASPVELDVGDVVTFGPQGSKHATMVREKGSDPLLWSDGHQGAPNFYRLSQDGREPQYLRLPAPHPAPTREDELRARTGWYAWAAWRLGEGDWRPYGATNPTVRPNVPKRIPAGWWTALIRFLAARNKGNRPSDVVAGVSNRARR